MFDKNLADYALDHFKRDGIHIKTEHHILGLSKGLPRSESGDGVEEEVEGDREKGFTLKLEEEGDVGVGMCVWSTGLMMNPFIEKALRDVHTFPSKSAILSSPPNPEGRNTSSETAKPENINWELKRSPKTGGLMVDGFFRVKLVTRSESGSDVEGTKSDEEATMKDVFALGDVAMLENASLPATAQVANQEAKWLAERLNAGGVVDKGKGFAFRNLGVMTYVGGMKAIMQTDGKGEIKGYVCFFFECFGFACGVLVVFVGFAWVCVKGRASETREEGKKGGSEITTIC